MLKRVKNAIKAIASIITDVAAVIESSERSSDPTGSLADPGPTRRESVLGLLEANGGRVWQQDVVVELDYSAPTVSRLLSAMETDNEITRYWKHGQKVVALPALGPEGGASASNRHQQRAT